ncbi:MAG: tRNA (adenosine(37)-N6)-dimethylallyltransferase MiaA [Syntrophus sp. (in: bacteria)]|nr:tRNA (adenosine(37)-N6)-dimethylallyltransferase MiaA [Syntrophus sp. (in: bacteria)]
MLRSFRKSYNLLVILGPTATGKTGLAVGLARRLGGGEIISADSRQVYRGMDLGTGKDLNEYNLGGVNVSYHLIDIFDPTEECNVFTYQKLFYRCFQEIVGRGNVPLMVGGSGLYLDAVIRGYRLPAVPENQALRMELRGERMASLRLRFLSLCPEVHNTTDLRERKRLIRAIEIAEFTRHHSDDDGPLILISPLVVGIRCERETLRRKITDRLEARLAAGMIEEVQALQGKGLGWERIDSLGLEYRYIGLYLRRKMTREEMVTILNTRIHQFAKRQETWFRRMEKSGVRIHWIENADMDKAISLIARLTA